MIETNCFPQGIFTRGENRETIAIGFNVASEQNILMHMAREDALTLVTVIKKHFDDIDQKKPHLLVAKNKLIT